MSTLTDSTPLRGVSAVITVCSQCSQSILGTLRVTRVIDFSSREVKALQGPTSRSYPLRDGQGRYTRSQTCWLTSPGTSPRSSDQAARTHGHPGPLAQPSHETSDRHW